MGIGILVVPRDERVLEHRGLKHIDWVGGFLITASTSIFLFSLVQSGVVNDGWTTPCAFSNTTIRGHLDRLTIVARYSSPASDFNRARRFVHVLGTTSRAQLLSPASHKAVLVRTS